MKKVFLLVLDFAIDGTRDINVEVYETLEGARAAMNKEYEMTLEEYDDYEDEYEIDTEEPDGKHAYIGLEDNRNEKHDEWKIIEKEVRK